jgi:hypothetical protein
MFETTLTPIKRTDIKINFDSEKSKPKSKKSDHVETPKNNTK